MKDKEQIRECIQFLINITYQINRILLPPAKVCFVLWTIFWIVGSSGGYGIDNVFLIIAGYIVLCGIADLSFLGVDKKYFAYKANIYTKWEKHTEKLEAMFKTNEKNVILNLNFPNSKTQEKREYDKSNREMSISEAYTKLKRTKELSDIANKTTDREEFYNSVKEIKDILMELSTYEGKLPFRGSPSADLKNLEEIEQEQMELLEKRITERKKETIKVLTSATDSNTKYNHDEDFQKDNNSSVKETFVEKETIKEIKIEQIEENSAPIEENSKSLEEKTKPNIFQYTFPSVFLLDKKQDSANYIEIKQRGMKLVQTFNAFGVNAEIVDISHGARFTRFEVQIEKGVRIKDILKIKDDIKLNLEAANLHIEAPIPGKTTIGIDVENKEVSIVTIREMIESREFQENPSNLTVAIGKDTVGNVIIESLENMCHLLIGGTTGTGKSVCISSIIMSILYKASPEKVKFLIIDTKAINLSIYNGIPHLMIPVVTDLRKATAALQWCVAEMTERYRKFADFGVRDLKGYNVVVGKNSTDDKPLQNIPSIVIIIDDFSDLMVDYNNEVEESVCRLAQTGRACGIHLIISTQRPSADVITGIIKANMPSRIAFNVFSAIDSRTILDAKGAEDLLPNGDMLFSPFGARKPIRVQGTFVSDEEITNVIEFVKNQMIG